MEHDDQKPDRPGWLPAGTPGTVTPARVGAAWDAVRARLPEWSTVVERLRLHPTIHDRSASTATWLVPQDGAGWWHLPIGIERLPSGATLLVPPAEHVHHGGPTAPAIHWTTDPVPTRGITSPGALAAAIHAARTEEWMPRGGPAMLPVGRWWDALLAPRHRAWSVAARLDRAPAIVSEDVMGWLVPVDSLDPDDLPEGCRVLTDGSMRVPPASAARTTPHARVPHLHWSMDPGDRAVITSPARLLRELRAAVPMPRVVR